ncbi:MAG: tetratricopeptide repeat protein, partial [Methanotrichaceae archaeon]|nr:tetratricopeptide repeat protein [Methanotrichaceae archaeon]
QLDTTARLKDVHDAAGNYLKIQADQGHAKEIGLSRLDCFLESRWHYISGGNLEKAREVTGRISGYLERRGYYREIMKLNRELLEREVHTEYMNWIASAYIGEGDYSRAQEWYEMAQEIKPEVVSCHGLGAALFHQGKYDQAKKSFEKALELCRSLGDLKGEAIAFHALASIEIEQKQDDAALEKMQKVVELQEKLGDLRGEAVTLSQMASLNLRRGKYEMAHQILIRALEILQLTEDKSGQASILHNLASIDLEKGDFDEAYKEFQRSLELKIELGDRKSQAEIFHQLGSIEAHKGIMVKANESFLEALKIYQSLENKSGEAGALFQLGASAVQGDRVEEGLRVMVLSAIILRTIGSDEIKSAEPAVERLASQLNYGQDQFLKLVREVSQAYRKDRGRGLVETALGS